MLCGLLRLGLLYSMLPEAKTGPILTSATDAE